MTAQLLLWAALGGVIGSTARYWTALWTAPISKVLPWGTIGINVAGSFIIGLFGTLALGGNGQPAPEWALTFVMAGLCGGFTTFSSFSLQTLDLLRSRRWWAALANVGLSVIVCSASVTAGYRTAVAVNAAVGWG